ncbi:MAG: IS200/IS605 family transposase [Cetobacterium sp.]
MNEYRRTSTTVSLINYHFVFCPRYRRKIFDNSKIEDVFKKTVIEVAEKNDIKILAIECDRDHAHIFVNALPKFSPSDIMKILKGNTSIVLRKEFPLLLKSPSLWTRSYFVSTAGSVSSDTIKRYVENQKKRG